MWCSLQVAGRPGITSSLPPHASSSRSADAVGDDLISRQRQVGPVLLGGAQRQHADRLARDAAELRRVEFNPLHAALASSGR